MTKRPPFLGDVDLTQVLLVVTVAELGVNRLAVPTMRPPGDTVPPFWHRLLDHAGLFLLFFATTLAIGVVAQQLWRIARRHDPYAAVPRHVLPVLGLVFLGLATFNILTNPGSAPSFVFDTSFTLILVVLVASQLGRDGDLGARLGVLLFAVPFIIHYWTPFALSFVEGEEAAWGDLPIRVQELGTWALVGAAMLSPYCFAPRPFVASAVRLGPLAIAAFVGLIGAVIVRDHYAVGMQLVSRGLGIDIGPGAPMHHLALYLMALAALTWTLTACLVAGSRHRNSIGVGIALVAVGGYGFNWPLQYVVGLAGLISISNAAAEVPAEEARGGFSGWTPPPISESVWVRWISSLVEALDAGADDPESEGESRKVSAVTARGEGEAAVTHVVTRRAGVPVQVRITRQGESIAGIEILCGAAPRPDTDPAWTLYARPERVLGLQAHREPPRTSAPVVKTGDTSFDQRFKVRDAGGHTDRLLDDDGRARATAIVDGWIAYWPGRGTHYCVLPGRGAPLDHPIPITELAFRGATQPETTTRLVTLVDFLARMTARAERFGDPL